MRPSEVKPNEAVIFGDKILIRGNFGGGNGQSDYIPAIIPNKTPFSEIGWVEGDRKFFHIAPVDVVNLSDDESVVGLFP